VSPLQLAIETLSETNQKIRSLIEQHLADASLKVDPLGMVLNGVVDAAVSGGIANYKASRLCSSGSTGGNSNNTCGNSNSQNNSYHPCSSSVARVVLFSVVSVCLCVYLSVSAMIGLCWTVFAWNRMPAEWNGDLQTLICVLVARPRRCLTLSNAVPRQNWMVAYLGYTLRMKTLFRGWPVMAHDMHTRRRRMRWFLKHLRYHHEMVVGARYSQKLGQIWKWLHSNALADPGGVMRIYALFWTTIDPPCGSHVIWRLWHSSNVKYLFSSPIFQAYLSLDQVAKSSHKVEFFCIAGVYYKRILLWASGRQRWNTVVLPHFVAMS